jgi:2-phospho-L-lactate guanylyltransferase
MHWTILIPLKALPTAKSRLRAPGSLDADHHRLVLALAEDTVRAAAGAGRVVVVTDTSTSAEVLGWPATVVLDDTGRGLNAALTTAALYARTQWPTDGLVAMLGDLPALTPDALSATLALASSLPRGYVPDASGVGTTMLSVAPGVELDPMFGPDSARAHADSGAVELAAPAHLRRDVDTAAELLAAMRLGVGPATRSAVGSTEPPTG